MPKYQKLSILGLALLVITTSGFAQRIGSPKVPPASWCLERADEFLTSAIQTAKKINPKNTDLRKKIVKNLIIVKLHLISALPLSISKIKNKGTGAVLKGILSKALGYLQKAESDARLFTAPLSIHPNELIFTINKAYFFIQRVKNNIEISYEYK